MEFSREDTIIISSFQPSNDLCSYILTQKGVPTVLARRSLPTWGGVDNNLTHTRAWISVPWEELLTSKSRFGGQSSSTFSVPSPCGKSYTYLPP